MWEERTDNYFSFFGFFESIHFSRIITIKLIV